MRRERERKEERRARGEREREREARGMKHEPWSLLTKVTTSDHMEVTLYIYIHVQGPGEIKLDNPSV